MGLGMHSLELKTFQGRANVGSLLNSNRVVKNSLLIMIDQHVRGEGAGWSNVGGLGGYLHFSVAWWEQGSVGAFLLGLLIVRLTLLYIRWGVR